MAFKTGTAANYMDLYKILITFLTTELGAAENWEIMRECGVDFVSGSSNLADYEPFRAIRGSYHDFGNGWATAVGQQNNSWIRWSYKEPYEILRFGFTGSGTVNQSPNSFKLQYSDDDGSTWIDRQSWTGITWNANEFKEWTLSGTSPGPKKHWRLFITSNNGNTSHTHIQQIYTRKFINTAEINFATQPAIWLKAPGLTGLDPCYVNLQVYARPTSDYYNIAISGATGFVGQYGFENQPGAITAKGIPLWNQPIQYWLSGNGQRFILSCKVDTVYMSTYAGKMLPYGLPTQFPYPLVIAAPFSAASAAKYSAGVGLPYKGNRGQLALRNSGGSWINPYCWPYAQGHSIKDTGGAYPLLPIVMYDDGANNTFGPFDDVYYIPGFNQAVENTITIDGKVYIVLQDGGANGLNDFFAQRIS